MKVIKDVRRNIKTITWYTIMVIVLNIILSWVPSFFVHSGSVTKTDLSTGIIALLLSGIFAPFFEETLMRGILQRWLETNTTFSLKLTYILVAVVFSILHFELYFLPFFCTSILLSRAYDHSKHNLIVPFLIHSFYNIFVIVMSS